MRYLVCILLSCLLVSCTTPEISDLVSVQHVETKIAAIYKIDSPLFFGAYTPTNSEVSVDQWLFFPFLENGNYTITATTHQAGLLKICDRYGKVIVEVGNIKTGPLRCTFEATSEEYYLVFVEYDSKLQLEDYDILVDFTPTPE